jgi:hypothetical protein
MTTSTRYLGTCAACGRIIKVRDGKLVHHGYQRPGYGYIVGDCFGVNYEPHETSPKCAEECKVFVTKRLEAERKALQKAPSLISLLANRARSWEPSRFEEVKKGDPEFEWRLEAHIRRLESDILMLEHEIVRLTGLLTDWSPKPLPTIEEEMAQKREAKAVRDAAKHAKRMVKVAAIVGKLRGRLESASRRKTASVFITIFEGAPDQLSDAAGGMSRKAAYEAIGHVEVWQKLGLLTEEGQPVYVEDRGRYRSYAIPYDVRRKVEEAIQAGDVGTLVFEEA